VHSLDLLTYSILVVDWFLILVPVMIGFINPHHEDYIENLKLSIKIKAIFIAVFIVIGSVAWVFHHLSK
jgi:hypothetical protein